MYPIEIPADAAIPTRIEIPRCVNCNGVETKRSFRLEPFQHCADCFLLLYCSDICKERHLLDYDGNCPAPMYEAVDSASEEEVSDTNSEAGSTAEPMDEGLDSEAIPVGESEAGSVDEDIMEDNLDQEVALDDDEGASGEATTSEVEQSSGEEQSDKNLSEESVSGEELSDDGVSDEERSSQELSDTRLPEEHSAIQIFNGGSPGSNNSDNHEEKSKNKISSKSEVLHKKDTTADELCQEFSRAKINNASSESLSTLTDLMNNLKLKKTTRKDRRRFLRRPSWWTSYVIINPGYQGERTGFGIIMSNGNSSNETLANDPVVRAPIRRFRQDFLSRYEKSKKQEVFKRLVDCFRLMVDDENTYPSDATAGSPSYAFEAMLDRANISIGRTAQYPLLPSWWNVEARENCIIYARERRSYPNIFSAANTTVITNDYNDTYMPKMLRLLAEKIYSDYY